MPITPKRLEELADFVSFLRPGEVCVLVGPCSATHWKSPRIPLDGRHYKCAGKLILKTGRELFANFRIRTDSFDFLETDSVYVLVGDTWYRMNEPELYAALGIAQEQALPYEWMPDRPLDYHKAGPYPMTFHQPVRKA